VLLAADHVLLAADSALLPKLPQNV
jgi:hypothetical protein